MSGFSLTDIVGIYFLNLKQTKHCGSVYLRVVLDILECALQLTLV